MRSRDDDNVTLVPKLIATRNTRNVIYLCAFLGIFAGIGVAIFSMQISNCHDSHPQRSAIDCIRSHGK